MKTSSEGEPSLFLIGVGVGFVVGVVVGVLGTLVAPILVKVFS